MNRDVKKKLEKIRGLIEEAFDLKAKEEELLQEKLRLMHRIRELRNDCSLEQMLERKELQLLYTLKVDKIQRDISRLSYAQAEIFAEILSLRAELSKQKWVYGSVVNGVYKLGALRLSITEDGIEFLPTKPEPLTHTCDEGGGEDAS